VNSQLQESYAMALAAYRHLLRATRIAFEGDAHLLHSARYQCRHDFAKNSSLASRSPEADKAIQHAEDVAKILRTNVVQAKQNEETGNLKLRIHDQIERGDNEEGNTGDRSWTPDGICRKI